MDNKGGFYNFNPLHNSGGIDKKAYLRKRVIRYFIPMEIHVFRRLGFTIHSVQITATKSTILGYAVYIHNFISAN